MPYTHNAADAPEVPASRDDLSLILPLDGEARNSSTVTNPLERVLNLLQRVWRRAGFLDIASTWTEKQTLKEGLDVDKDVAITNGNLSVQGSGTFASLSLSTPQTTTLLATAFGGLRPVVASIEAGASESAGAGSFYIGKSNTGDSQPMMVAASFDIPGGALIKEVGVVVTNTSATVGTTLIFSAYLRTSVGTRTAVVGPNLGKAVNGGVSSQSYSSSVATPVPVPAGRGVRLEFVCKTSTTANGSDFIFHSAYVTYSITGVRQ